MKNILIVVNDLKMGGVSTSLLYLIKTLEDYNVKVDVISLTKKAGAFDSDIKTTPLNGLKKYWVLPKDLIKHEKQFKSKMITLSMMIMKLLLGKNWNRFIKRFSHKLTGYDIAVAYRQSDSTMRFVLDMVDAKEKMVFIHGNVKFMPNFEKWCKHLSKFNRVICVAHSLKNELIEITQLPESKVAVIYNVVDQKRIERLSEKLIENSALDKLLSENYFGMTFVTVARLDPIKAVDRVIDITTRLAKTSLNNFRWIVIGGGDLLNEFRQRVIANDLGNYLYFIGESKNPFPIIKKSDLFILTSKSEGYPIVVLESILLKVPVLVTRYPAAAEQVEDSVNGFIVENNTESIEAKLIEILGNPQMIFAMHKNLLLSEISNQLACQQIQTVFNL